MLERFKTPASSEDGKLNISGDQGDLLPPHLPDGPVSGVAVVAQRGYTIQPINPNLCLVALELTFVGQMTRTFCLTLNPWSYKVKVPENREKNKTELLGSKSNSAGNHILFTYIQRVKYDSKQCIDINNKMWSSQVKYPAGNTNWLTWRRSRWAIITGLYCSLHFT